MLTVLDDLLFMLSLPRGNAIDVYDRVAPRYDHFHKRWLRTGGAQSVAAVQGCLAAELRPGVRVLDAACGTGAIARWMLEQEPQATLTLVDAAPGMLERARAVPGRIVHADIQALPFADREFDIVICAWALETVDDPEIAIAELRRVLAPGGLLCYCFCSLPAIRLARLRSLFTRLAIERLFGGRFLVPDALSQPAQGGIRRMRYHQGLSTFTCQRKPATAGA